MKTFISTLFLIVFYSVSLNSQNLTAETVNFEEVVSQQTGIKAPAGSFYLIKIKNMGEKKIGDYDQLLTLDEIDAISIYAEKNRLENETRYITISPFLQLVILPASIINSPNFQPNTNLFFD